MEAYRQGDVVVTKAEIPKEATLSNTVVLAEGEATGHAHRIAKGKAQIYYQAVLGLMYLRVLSDHATIGHEEHEDMVLPRGEYHVHVQREYDWFNEIVRRVVD